MKIYFDNVNFESEHTGPNCFAKRLAIALGNLGHVVADPDDYDVALVFIEPTDKLNLNKPFVQRLDGIWFKPEQMSSGMNNTIMHCYKTANSVIWQSEFDKKMTQRWFGDRTGVVISNGIELKRAAVRSEQLIDMRATYDKIFVCSANWHPQKRLRDNIEIFQHLKKTQFPNSCLIVMGSNPDYHIADKSIFYAGNIRHDLCSEVYAIADWMIHLAYLDHAPNVVIEAISQGCPVICASNGGTREIVEFAKGNGIIIQETSEYDYSLVDYDNPPSIKFDNIPTLIQMKAQPYTVDITHIAKKYENIMTACLKQ